MAMSEGVDIATPLRDLLELSRMTKLMMSWEMRTYRAAFNY
jgi:hypothetical protein